MAGEKTKGPSKTKKGRKVGRNRDKCARYKALGRLEINKARRVVLNCSRKLTQVEKTKLPDRLVKKAMQLGLF